ncbi:unnamed protein product [Rotaria sp. Silwood2]|nr:unnamed protein product [Rotaria sp. Silwood2]CAF3042420.1 unnamed protein product [Rotaria sp. Silwood2]CAF3310571.1 unnamed protein product [Rotaria sp. Silwood2]CAF3387889.1 unnamed protein product [Rotaria sp. Silwood2]CAF4059645.1 unnamed protein product [Rotaria sp. Silwood2]
MFFRSCSSLPNLIPMQHNDTTFGCPSGLFRCHGSFRCISPYRLLDDFHDCINSTDEDKSMDTCAFNLNHQFHCTSTSCIPRRKVMNSFRDCINRADEIGPSTCVEPRDFGCQYARGTTDLLKAIPFSFICNGLDEIRFVQNLEWSDSSNATDESECLAHEWSCNNRYTRCNGIWNCPNGTDELNCTRTDVFLDKAECEKTNRHFCIRVDTHEWSCLDPIKAGDNQIDCLGK